MFTTLNFYISIFLLLIITTASSQVAIGTTDPDDGSALEIESTTGALVPPRMSEEDMDAIPTPLDGAVVYNTTTNTLNVRQNGIWKGVGNKTLLLNRIDGSFPIAADDTYLNFPLSSTNNLYIDNDTYEMAGNGAIKIKRGGIFMLSASFSTSNLPNGIHKYIIAAYKNSKLIGYLSRGFATIPGTGSDTGFFGTSGSIMYNFISDDILEFKYVLNNNGNDLTAKFFNIGINKVN